MINSLCMSSPYESFIQSVNSTIRQKKENNAEAVLARTGVFLGFYLEFFVGGSCRC